MKKLILNLFVISNIFCIENKEQVSIVDYDASHKDAAMEIFFQDPMLFFGASHLVTTGIMSREVFESENRKGMEAILNDSLRIKKVLINDGKVIGFVNYFRTKEHSLESFKNIIEGQGQSFDENQILSFMPNIKKTDAECELFAKIEALVISKDYRGKGFGKKLLQHAIDNIKQLYSSIKCVKIDVNANNEIAKKLYESQGFELSPIQNSASNIMNVLEYLKNL